jgi:6-pyruvoyltetrahydropterin/6-carboxytetrahydropterin synthase
VELAVAGPVDEATGWFIDFQRIFDAWSPLYDRLDHNYLNEIPGLENPTSEVLAGWIWDRVKRTLPPLVRVTVFETCESRCEYDGPDRP